MSILQLAIEHLKELSQPAVGVPLGRPLGVSHGTVPAASSHDQPSVEIATEAARETDGTIGTDGTLGTGGTAGRLGRSSPTDWLDALLSHRRPEGEPPPRWNNRCAGVRQFVEGGWHRKAAALGWSHDELFGLGTGKVRGAAWFIGDDRVLFVTGDLIMACSKSGLAQPIYRGVDYSRQESGR